MANEFVKVLDTIGHDCKVVFDDGKTILEKLPEVITVADDLAKDAPTAVADVTALAVSIEAAALPFETLAGAIEANGANVAADITLVAAEYKNFPAAWATVKAKFTTLAATLGADEKQIAAIFAVQTVAPAPEAATFTASQQG